jgi:hypothetical protein
MPRDRWGARGKKVLRFEYDPAEREEWNRDARELGFKQCGTVYIRWLLEMRRQGRLMLLDPATMTFAQMIGKTLGSTAGEVIARMERMYLEGK